MENMLECLLSWYFQVSHTFKMSFLKFLLFSSVLLVSLDNSLFTPLFCFGLFFSPLLETGTLWQRQIKRLPTVRLSSWEGPAV